MGIMINKEAYRRLIEEDIVAMNQSDCSRLEKWHIEAVLKDSIDRIYGKDNE